MIKKLYSALFLSAFVLSLSASTFDPGGVTFPMEEISRKRFAPVPVSEKNVLNNRQFLPEPPHDAVVNPAWRPNIMIMRHPNHRIYYKDSSKIATARIIEVDGGKCMELNRPLPLQKLMGDQTGNFTINYHQWVKLPDNNGGLYRFTMETQNQLIGDYRHDQMVLVYFWDLSDDRDGHRKQTRRYIYYPVQDTPQWHPYSVDIRIPPRTTDLKIYIRGDGCGRYLARNPQLIKLETEKQPISVLLTPAHILDQTYALAMNAPGMLSFKFKTNLKPRQLEEGDYFLNLILPEKVDLIGTNQTLAKDFSSTPAKLNGKAARHWTVSCNPIIPSTRKAVDYINWHVPAVMIRSSQPAGTRWEGCRYYITKDGKTVSNSETFTLFMIEPMKKVPFSKYFSGGFSSVPGDLTFHQPAAKELLTEFLADTGSSLMAGAGDVRQKELLRKSGVRYLTSEAYGFANGFRIGYISDAKRPDYATFRDKDGNPIVDGPTRMTCPAAIYRKTPYFHNVVVPQLKEALKAQDGLQPNWEPFRYLAKGCFCKNCLAEFAKFAGISLEEAKKLWPDQLLPGYPHWEEAIRFRAWQHGSMIKTLHETCMELGATEVGFCPEVGTNQVIRYPSYKLDQWEYTPYAYAGDLKWLNVWGPYVWFKATQPYNYVKGAHLRYWEMSRRVVRDYRKHLPDPKHRARLMAMPHGCQGGMTALGQPEGLAMDQISAFLAGYDASQLYFFPRGYDHRYWKALAACNQFAADHDDMVVNGTRTDRASAVAVTPYPSPISNVEPKFLPDIHKTDLLQVQSFSKDGKYLVALGNFWEKGDVVCRMKFTGLPKDQKFTVLEKAFGRQFTRNRRNCFTGQDLEDGILLHVGALRWAFFDIMPYESDLKAKIVTAAAMGRELTRCSMRVRRAARQEVARDKALLAENDIGELKPQKQGGLSCSPVTRNGASFLKISAGKNSILLNPKGMMVDSWIIDGKENCRPRCGISAFWSPGKNGMIIEQNYRMTRQVLGKDGFSCTAVHTTTPVSYPQLHGIRITKTIALTRDLKQMTITVKLHNTHAEDVGGVGYRWSMVPPAWINPNHGTIANGGQQFQRPHDFMLLKRSCDPGSEKEIRRLFKVSRPTVAIQSNRFLMKSTPESAMELTFLPADQFGGAAIWDTPSMLGATFEPFYKTATIPPEGDITYSVILKAVNSER